MNLEAIKQKNRRRNSGGIPPNAQQHALKLIAALKRLRQHYKPKKEPKSAKVSDYDRALLYFLYLWLTGQLKACQDARDIPDLDVVSGSQPCQAHRLRKIRKTTPSWVEYAHPYPTKAGVVWQWQPIPNGLNDWFYHALSQRSNGSKTWRMDHKEKQRFSRFINTKWRTPSSLEGYRLIRRDVFYDYFKHMMQTDAHLPTPSKHVGLKGESLHHKSALAYQVRNSKKIRSDLFHAQTRYLARLRQSLPLALSGELNAPKACTFVEYPLLHASASLQAYLTVPGEIDAFHYDYFVSKRDYVPLPSVDIGSQRLLIIDDLRRFFKALAKHGDSLERKVHTLTSLKTLHNFRAYELALLLISLTGTRPTHAISIEKQYCFDQRQALVFDKGHYRPIWLNGYFRSALQRYQTLHISLHHRVPHLNASPYLWFELNDDLICQPLSAKRLRQFMHDWWGRVNPHSQAVPYQLRHNFAQHALNSPSAKLTTTDVDRLMGHSSIGERLGSDALFPVKEAKLIHFLNGIPGFLHLPPIKGAPL